MLLLFLFFFSGSDNTILSEADKFTLDVEDSAETAIINSVFFGDVAFR